MAACCCNRRLQNIFVWIIVELCKITGSWQHKVLLILENKNWNSTDPWKSKLKRYWSVKVLLILEEEKKFKVLLTLEYQHWRVTDPWKSKARVEPRREEHEQLVVIFWLLTLFHDFIQDTFIVFIAVWSLQIVKK